MSTVDPNLLALAPTPQDLLDEARLGASLLGPGVPGAAGGLPPSGANPANLGVSPAELGDDAFVQLTAAAQNWFSTEQQDGVPNSIISVQQMLSTLLASMSANATIAFATASELSPNAALALTQL